MIAFCGVHFMAETASILSPDKTVLLPDLDAGCSLADSITADELRDWKAEHPGAVVVMYVNTTAEVKAETDYCCTSSNAVQVVEHIWREHGDDTEILFGPDMWLGAYVERETGRRLHVWDGECHVHAGIRPADISRRPRGAPGRRVPDPPGVRLHDAGDGVRRRRRRRLRAHPHAVDGRDARLRRASRTPTSSSSRPRRACCTRSSRRTRASASSRPTGAAVCRYMKMITLPKLRDALRDLEPQVNVDAALAERARVPIERMVAIGP